MARTTKPKIYPCPRCGKPLARDGKTPAGKQRWSCREYAGTREYCYRTTDPASKSVLHHSGKPEGPPPVFKRKLEPTKRYIITAAQNATPLHAGFWRALIRASQHYDAELLVIPLRYKNPTSRWTTKNEGDEWWDKEAVPFLWNVRKSLNENVAVLGDVKIQPTAVEPLTGLEGFTGAESTIVGHTKLAFRTVPTPGHKMAKIMTTTGACTQRNYTDSRAGKHGEFHHTLGAVIVEIEGKKFWLRHLNANKDGSFTDLDTRFEADKIEKASPPEAIVFGDMHVAFCDPGVEKGTFGAGGMVPVLSPRKLVFHDLLDAYAVNGHHAGNPFNAIAKLRSGFNDVAREVEQAIDFLVKRTPPSAQAYVVSSNHDDMLRRYIIGQDWRSDPQNAEFYLETALAMVRETKMGEGGASYPAPFPHWVRRRALANIHCLATDESLNIAGIECGYHGDTGPNGARGSIKNMRRIGAKTIIGHSHSPGVSEGCYQVGTSSRLKLEYNKGPSSWLHCHALIHKDGKRQLVVLIDGRWRL